MLGAFVPVALKNASAHAAGIANAVKTARLLAAVAATPAPYLVLADDNGSVPERTRLAGRVTPAAGLSPAEWKVFAAGADQLARAVYEETGLQTVFHHHCAGYVETPDEIATLLELTNPETPRAGLRHRPLLLWRGRRGLRRGRRPRALRRPGLVHPLQGLRAGGRAAGAGGTVGLLHGVAPRSLLRTGQGLCGFPGPAAAAARRAATTATFWWNRTSCPEWARPKESARRNREYLRSIESNFSDHSKEDTLSTKQLNVGIIGAGRIGKVHAETLAFRLPEAQTMAIADVNREAAQALAARCGIPTVAESGEEILANPASRGRADLLFHQHARRPHRPGGAGGQAHLLREADRP